jgi:threonine/homoserine/homoserine lactone efflux protein
MNSLFEFLLASIALTLMPGPDIIFVVSQSVINGKKAGILIALGLCTGLIGHITASALGLSLIMVNSPTIFSIVKYSGALYLVYLGFLSIKNSKKKQTLTPTESNTEVQKLYGRGILMNLLNPKVTLFFLAFLPQFIHSNKPSFPISIQIFILGFIFIAQALTIFIIVSWLSNKMASLLIKSQGNSILMGIISALIYFAIGVGIIWDDIVKLILGIF